MLETRTRKARHIQEEMIQYSAKAWAGTAKAKAKGSKDSRTRRRSGTTTLNVGIVESSVLA